MLVKIANHIWHDDSQKQQAHGDHINCESGVQKRILRIRDMFVVGFVWCLIGGATA